MTNLTHSNPRHRAASKSAFRRLLLLALLCPPAVSCLIGCHDSRPVTKANSDITKLPVDIEADTSKPSVAADIPNPPETHTGQEADRELRPDEDGETAIFRPPVIAPVPKLSEVADSDQTESQNQENLMFSALKERYAGKIDAHVGGSEAYRHIGLVSRLFQEWNPVGHPAEQVKALLGEPTSEKDGYLEYRFDSGLNGIIWRFHVGDGRVTEIEKIPLE